MVPPDQVPRGGDGGSPGEDEKAGDQRDQHLSRVTNVTGPGSAAVWRGEGR